MAIMLQQLEDLESNALSELSGVTDGSALESWRILYLGTKGKLRQIMPLLKDVVAADKPAVGKRLNEVKKVLESAFEQAKAGLGSAKVDGQPAVDLTEPGVAMGVGRRHVLSRTDR